MVGFEKKKYYFRNKWGQTVDVPFLVKSSKYIGLEDFNIRCVMKSPTKSYIFVSRHYLIISQLHRTYIGKNKLPILMKLEEANNVNEFKLSLFIQK